VNSIEVDAEKWRKKGHENANRVLWLCSFVARRITVLHVLFVSQRCPVLKKKENIVPVVRQRLFHSSAFET
jgi:hypothetical protein